MFATGRRAQVVVGALCIAGAAGAARIMRRRALQQWTPPSGSVSHGSLAARHLGGSGPPVVLLHGMAGSHVYWGGHFDVLSERARLTAVDLLGFGESPKPDSGYGPRQHAAALAACLAELGIDEPAILVGHSTGTLVALALAKYHPELVERIVAIAPPIYSSRADGMRHIRAMGTLEGLMAFGSTSHLMCRWMCSHRALAGRLAPFVEPSLPPAIVRAAVQHTWASYSQTMEELILSCESATWLAATTRPVQLIVALDDPVPDIPLLSRLREASDLISLDVWRGGGHHLPLTQPDRCLEAIRRAIARVGTASLRAADAPLGTAAATPPAVPTAGCSNGLVLQVGGVTR